MKRGVGSKVRKWSFMFRVWATESSGTLEASLLLAACYAMLCLLQSSVLKFLWDRHRNALRKPPEHCFSRLRIIFTDFIPEIKSQKSGRCRSNLNPEVLNLLGLAHLQVYRHNDMAHLEELLEASGPGKRRLVVTDTLFSMDGDFADLAGLAALRKKHGFLLVADEAHATLVCGER